MTSTRSLPHDLQRAVDGDLSAFQRLIGQPHETLRGYQKRTGKLTLTSQAVRSVIHELQHGEVEPQLVQQWASFARRGYITGVARGPIKPIDIAYEASKEDAIVEVIARLDEIGDLLDGELTDGEIAALLEQLDT